MSTSTATQNPPNLFWNFQYQQIHNHSILFSTLIQFMNPINPFYSHIYQICDASPKEGLHYSSLMKISISLAIYLLSRRFWRNEVIKFSYSHEQSSSIQVGHNSKSKMPLLCYEEVVWVICEIEWIGKNFWGGKFFLCALLFYECIINLHKYRFYAPKTVWQWSDIVDDDCCDKIYDLNWIQSVLLRIYQFQMNNLLNEFTKFKFLMDF